MVQGHYGVITGLLSVVCKHLLVLTVPKEHLKDLMAETKKDNGEGWP